MKISGSGDLTRIAIAFIAFLVIPFNLFASEPVYQSVKQHLSTFIPVHPPIIMVYMNDRQLEFPG